MGMNNWKLCPLAICIGSILVAVGCDRIPDEVLNSPPAKRPGERIVVAKKPIEPPSLEAEVSSAEIKATANDALARLGQPSLPILVTMLRSADAGERERAALTLARMGPAAADAAEALVERLEDPQEEPAVKLASARAIGQIGRALWPEEPQLQLEPPSLEPLPELSEEFRDDADVVALHQRRVARRVEYDERNENRRRYYDEQMEEYRRRSAIAQRAVDALAALAAQG